MSNEKTGLKEKISDCALQLFKEQGYKQVSIDQIVAAAGTSKGGFYHYYSSKDELLVEIWESLDDNFEEWYLNTRDSHNSIELLHLFNKMVLRAIECDMEFEQIFLLYSTQLNFTDKTRLFRSSRKYNQIITDIIRKGQNCGEIRQEPSCRELTKMYVTVQRGIIYDWCLAGGIYNLEEYGAKIIRFYLQSYKNDNPTQPDLT